MNYERGKERMLGNEKRSEVESLRLRKEEGTHIRGRVAERKEPRELVGEKEPR